MRQVSTTSFSELEEQKTWPTSTRRWIMNVCVVSCMRIPNQTEPAPWAKWFNDRNLHLFLFCRQLVNHHHKRYHLCQQEQEKPSAATVQVFIINRNYLFREMGHVDWPCFLLTKTNKQRIPRQIIRKDALANHLHKEHWRTLKTTLLTKSLD